MKARYIRVSTGNQKTARQEQKASREELIYTDIISGVKNFNERPEGRKLIKDIIDGKITSLAVSSIDRLGRNLVDILKTVEFLNLNKINLRVDNLGLDSIVNSKENTAFKLIISVMGSVAEMERETILERQREGIMIAKLNGAYKGRVKGSKESNEIFLDKYKDVIKNLKKGNSFRDTAKICRVSVGTVQKVNKLLSNK
ncbi:DNA invertase Pin-like site-specific DNA recombinase [Chryseobacterium vietnamense]|jgi:DNA invertase Pin-like site-specific DNA recombinase|uniref:DNA invertase Pin-like site-specific DNA recombinase n=1 Tax=Chryseobacterium vietnamense TaxID=866785 RepID=A0ACC6JAA0_9FLAO|nr:recombinase family protein [Chryseobacterium vietnamense]MDR6459926.1 DNA invertase Pin-like site-specific DNA recombinase [Chryseobacterium vietnamense]